MIEGLVCRGERIIIPEGCSTKHDVLLRNWVVDLVHSAPPALYVPRHPVPSASFPPEPPLGTVYLEGLRFRLISRNDSEN